MTYAEFKALKLSKKMKDLIKEVETNPNIPRDKYLIDNRTIKALFDRGLIKPWWNDTGYSWKLTNKGFDTVKYCVDDVSLLEIQARIEALDDIANMPHRLLERANRLRKEADKWDKKYHKYKAAAVKAAEERDLLKAKLESLGGIDEGHSRSDRLDVETC